MLYFSEELFWNLNQLILVLKCFQMVCSNRCECGAAEEVCVPQNLQWVARGAILYCLHAQHRSEGGQFPWHHHLELDLWRTSCWFQGQASNCVFHTPWLSVPAGHSYSWPHFLERRVAHLFNIFLTQMNIQKHST